MASKKVRFPKVSIVTPSYNQASYIERNILSVLNQGYPNLEHIVMDGGSKDGTVAILRKYRHLKWVSRKDNGQSDAINRGFRRAKGEIIGWLNSDDTYNPGAVNAAVGFFKSHPDCDILYSRVNVIDENDRKIGDHFIFPHSRFVQLNMNNCIPQQGVFFRRKILDEVGYLDESLNFVMDYEFWVRIGAKKKFAMVPGTWANFRVAQGTKTSESYDRFFNETLEVNRKYGGFPYFWLLIRHGRRVLAGIGLLGAARRIKNNLHRIARRD